ncbi:MAG: helix-turn-helix domain-containing protein [Patescibacteria group bacterium]
MNNSYNSLQKIGLTEKEIEVYLALLTLGPVAIRKIAAKAGINRGSTYDALKILQKEGLVSYYHKGKLQHFVAEDPKILSKILARKKLEIIDAAKDIENIIPELSSLSGSAPSRPVVKFYEGYSGIRTILEDTLDSVAKLKKKEYVAFSSSAIRPYLYHKSAFPNFSESRIKRKIFVRTIAYGAGGGTYGRDERKWILEKESAPTYILIYAGKVAMISVGKNDVPHGLIIEDAELHKTQLAIFNSLWKAI